MCGLAVRADQFELDVIRSGVDPRNESVCSRLLSERWISSWARKSGDCVLCSGLKYAVTVNYV